MKMKIPVLIVIAVLFNESLAQSREIFGADGPNLIGPSAAEILASDWSNQNDDIDDGLTMDESVGARVQAEAALTEDGQILLQGDMKLDPTQLRRFYERNAGLSGAAVNEDERWPHGVIPYSIDPALDGEPARVVLGAMREWMERTCVRFEPVGGAGARGAGHDNSIQIVDGAGCRSGIGYRGKSYTVSLSKKSCTRHKSHLHELGHAIGLHHEQCRPERDRAIQIVWDNISMMGSLQYVKEEATANFSIPYDFCSIMHYGPKYFSSNRKFTMLARDQSYQWTMGSAQHLSFNDAKIVNLMYECNKSCGKAINSSCKSPCYVNHKCRCECDENPCEKIPCEKKSSRRDCEEAKRILKYGR